MKGQILDPSAGEGHLLDYISNYEVSLPGVGRAYSRGKKGLYAIEIDPGRQAILREKGYGVIDSDFLSYNGVQYFDIIAMNPPFEDGAAHLLKAWDVANGATIRCLLNSETINNPYTKDRKRLKYIIKRYGWTQSLGQCFRDAKRKTDVFVTLVHLSDTRKKEAFRLDFEPSKVNGRFKAEDDPDGELIPSGVFQASEANYNAAIEAFKEMLQAQAKVAYYLGPILPEYGKDHMVEAMKAGHGPDESYGNFVRDVTKDAWSNLFRKTKLSRIVTESVERELEAMQAVQGRMAFTVGNMEQLFNQLFESREKIIIDCALEAFDLMTRWYDDNRVYVEGWKTNASYKVGKRVILPHMLSSYFPENGVDYSASRKLADIEKALCFLSGKKFDEIQSITTVYANDSFFGKLKTSEFFHSRLYKKGTIHLEFRDLEMLENFNALIARERWGEIPEKTKKGAYA
jgi:hypothetical protein